MRILRFAICCMLSGLLTAHALADEKTAAERIRQLKPGRKIEVVLTTDEKIIGRLGSVSAEHLLLEPEKRGTSQSRTIDFQEVRSVRPKGMTRGVKWATFGIVWVVLSIIGSRLI